ncbi:MAG TPA: 16S rRNA (cytosine(967)-C(5))-methyltransferase RsmB [Clostridiaceae bacterium]|nr:16S rRNA (cytosine(967)-C(5))-methyltransferase RsmB [Clostridiaceae bacterium]
MVGYVDFSRETALKILYDINEKGAYSNIAINKHLNSSNFGYIDKTFITGLVYGTIKWKLTIDRIIGEFSNMPLKKLSPWILNILRLGVYQLLYTDRIPDSAACNESVKLATKYGYRGSKGYVNGVLRNIARKGSEYKCPTPDRNVEPVGYLSIKYSHPGWMVKRWIDLFGEDFTESLLQSNNENPDFTVRANTIKISKDEFIKEMDYNGIEYLNGRYIDNAFIINNPTVLTNSELYRKGYFQIQDEASMLVSHILNPLPGEIVIDVCAAPGGKTSHIAQLMGNKGIVISRDIHKHKIRLINETVARLGLDIVKTELYDATMLDQDYIEKADRVLVDAPCTGLGIIRRKPDIKWTRHTEDKEKIRSLQLSILRTSAEYVKPGGILVYSTCTIEPDENIEIVREFLESNNQFHMMGFEELLSSELIRKTVNETSEVNETKNANEVKENEGKNAKEGYMQLFPNIDNTDGFFIAKMRKRG